MKRISFKVLSCVAAVAMLLAASVAAQAAGFGLYEWSARGNAMGGALVALADDPSAIAYNPAGITQLEGTQTLAGVSFITASADLEAGGQKYNTKGKVYAPPHAYLTHQINEDLWAGIGVYTRYGLGTNYDHNWAGAANVYKASIESFSITPVLAYKVTDAWTVAGGAEIVYAAFDLKRNHPVIGDWHMNNEGMVYGWNVSTRYEFNDEWSAGAMYRTSMRMSGHGSSRIDSRNIRDELTMTAVLPASLSMGVAYKPADWWRIELDATYTEWSDYDTLDFAFGTQVSTLVGPSASSIKDWHDAWRVGIGAEFDVWENYQLRFGYVYDQSPINDGNADYMVPTNDRQLFSLGLGYIKGPWELDMSYTYLISKDRHIDANAAKGIVDTDITNSKAHILGFSVGYKF